MEQSEPHVVTDAGKTNCYPAEAQGSTISKAPPAPKIIQKKPTPDVYDTNSSYIEPEDPYPNELEYPRNGSDQGLVIIFNQVHFEDESSREGSIIDVKNIAVTLGRLGYNINKDYILSNLTTNEIHIKLQQIEEEDLSDRNSLILIFLTHGYLGDTLFTRDGEINAKAIWNKLGNHKNLNGKPKLFVFQACKGCSLSVPSKLEYDDKKHKITSLSFVNYALPSDILICFSSAEGMKSYRHIEKGTWLVQEICRNFLTFGRRDDVITLLTRVAKCVSTFEHENTKQMPVIISTLSKKFYLTKRKERIYLLANLELHNKIMQHFEELKSLIENK